MYVPAASVPQGQPATPPSRSTMRRLRTHIYIYIYTYKMCIYIYIYIYTHTYTHTYLCIHPSIYPSIRPSIYLSIYLSKWKQQQHHACGSVPDFASSGTGGQLQRPYPKRTQSSSLANLRTRGPETGKQKQRHTCGRIAPTRRCERELVSRRSNNCFLFQVRGL